MARTNAMFARLEMNSRTTKSPQIALLWHSLSSDNLGVGALTLGQLSLLESLCKELNLSPHYTVLGTRGSRNYVPSDLKSRVEQVHFSPKLMLKALLSPKSVFGDFDLILDIGEGDSFADIYGSKRCLKMLLSKWAAQRAQVPIILSPQTIGPFNSAASRFFSTWLMSKLDCTFTRDKLSSHFMARCARPNTAWQESSDLAFLLPFSKTVKENSSPAKVGLNVSSLLFSGGYTGRNQFELRCDYQAAIEQLIERLHAENAEVWLVPHVIPSHLVLENDAAVNEQLKEMIPRLKTAPSFASPSEAKSFISNLDFFIGSRMHSTIAALSSGVPVAPIAYSRKFSGLYESLGYAHTINAKTADTEEVVSRAMQLFSERDKLKIEAINSAKNATANLESYRDYVRAQLSSIAAQ